MGAGLNVQSQCQKGGGEAEQREVAWNLAWNDITLKEARQILNDFNQTWIWDGFEMVKTNREGDRPRPIRYLNFQN